jgi:hypothetical protein
MQLFNLTTTVNADGIDIVRAAGRIADHPDYDEQQEWIDFQISIDEPTVRNGAILRIKILEQVRDIIGQSIKDYENLVPEYQSETPSRLG